MPTPVSGSISFSDLFNEFRGSGVGTVHAISLADVYNNANLSVGTIGTSVTENVDFGNIISRSEEFNNARWTKNLVGVQADQEVAPDGALTADKLTSNGAGSYVEQTDLETIQPNTTYNHSVYVKGLGTSIGAVVAIGNFDNGARVGATSITLTANWQRMSASFVGTATFSRNIFIQLNGAAGAGATANLATNQSVFAWGYQITTGAALRVYVRTAASIAQPTLRTITVFTNTSVAALGAISMNQFYGISKPSGRVTITINVPAATFTSNLDLYKIALRSGYTTGITDVVLNVGTGAIVGSAGSSVTETVTISSSTATNYFATGNLIPNSADMSNTGRWANGGFISFTTAESVISGNYGIVSPNRTTTGILAVTVTTVTGNNYYEPNANPASTVTFYSGSVWVKGFGSSIGQKVGLRMTFGAASNTSVTLTARWQRLGTQLSAAAGNFRPTIFLNGGSATNTYTNNMLLNNQTVFFWGMQMTTSINGTTGINVNLQYVETTTGPIAGTVQSGTHNIYTTSETLVTSYAVYVPSRFNAADTVRITNNGHIVGESGKGGQGGSAAAAPAFGYPTPVQGKVGGRGGDALGVFRPVTIDNLGVIAGGGGGGGGGNAGPGTPTTQRGGSGGGGAGADSNPGYVDINSSLPSPAPAPSPANSYTLGTPSTPATFTAGTGGIRTIGTASTATPGANGGALGTTGSTSTASPLAGAVPGGAPGHYVVGSPLVTWVSTGTRSGTVG
jgi:hypothetical protein